MGAEIVARDLELTPMDWEFLRETALIHADVWANWNLDRLPELAARVSRYL